MKKITCCVFVLSILAFSCQDADLDPEISIENEIDIDGIKSDSDTTITYPTYPVYPPMPVGS